MSGILSGAGSLTKTGMGTLTLTGVNTYTGGTAINAGGALQIGAGAAAGSVTGNITDNGTVVFNRSDAVTYASVVSGGSALTKQGAGTLALSGANSYSGTTTITAGTLQIGAGGMTGGLSPSSALVDNSVLAFNRTNTLTQSTDFPSVISGTGGLNQGEIAGAIVNGTGAGNTTSLIKAGTGAWTLSMANTFTGTTTVNGGSLAVSATGALGGTSGVTINGGGTLLLSGSTGVTDRVNNAAPLTINNGGAFRGGLLRRCRHVFGQRGGGHLTLTFPRQRDASDITYRVMAYRVMAGNTLSTASSEIWSSATVPYAGGAAASAPVVVTDPQAVGDQSPRFLWLKVTQP